MEPPRVTTEAAGDEAVRGKVTSGSFDMRAGGGGVLTDLIVQTLSPRLFGFPLTSIRTYTDLDLRCILIVYKKSLNHLY